MRVIVPFTKLSPGCAESLNRHAPHAERVYVGDHVTDYWRLLCRVWADGRDFILCEHDVEFEASALEILEACPRWFCTIAGYFRLTRFRSELIQAVPDAFSGLPVSERHWVPLEWAARLRLEAGIGQQLHSHLFEAEAWNAQRQCGALLSTEDRAVVWAAWLRTLPPEAADRWTAWAWRQVHRTQLPDGSTVDDGRACERPACWRRGPRVFPSVCDRCRAQACDASQNG